MHSNHAGLGIEGKELTLQVARTIPEVEELRETWKLWCDDPDADIDYFLASTRWKTDFVRPHVMLVYRDGQPDCMLIGRLEHTRLSLNVGYTTLFRPRVRRLFFVQGGFLGNQSQQNSAFLIRGIMSCLHQREADTAEFIRLREDSSLYRASREEPNFFCRGHVMPVHEHRSVKLPDSFDAFLQGLSRKNRHELRRHEKKLTADFAGQMRIHCFRKEEELGDLAREVNKVSETTYQRAIGVGFKTDVETVESLRIAARRGGLRGCVLYLAQQPCAFFIGNQYKSTFHGNFMGFDSRFGKYSPGLYILMHSIEECFEPDHRATQLDLGWGDRQYKRAFCNQMWKDGPAYLYAFSFKGLKLNLLRSGTSLIDLWARKLLLKSTLLQGFRKGWLHWRQQSRGSSPKGAGCEDDGADCNCGVTSSVQTHEYPG